MSGAMAVLRVGVCCPVGLDAAQTATAMRAGVTRKSETEMLDGDGAPVVMGHLARELLAPLRPGIAERTRSVLEQRMLRLAARPLREVLSKQFDHAVLPLYLAGPSAHVGQPELVPEEFPALLAAQAKLKIEHEASRVFASDNTGFFTALCSARDELLTTRRSRFVVVGGVDSFHDQGRIDALHGEGRLRTSGPQDAFTPGEGAAFVILATEDTCRRHSLIPLAWITTVSVTDEAEQGLARACGTVLRGAPDPIRLVMAGLNGESKPAREWGITVIRNREHLADQLRVEHPAEYTGDAGVALAPMMLASAALRLRAGMVVGPALVWAGSGVGQRGALVMYAGA